MHNYKKYDYIIGIDPGVNTGIAIWQPKKKWLSVVDCSIAVLAENRIYTFAFCSEEKTLVRFEDARLRTWFGKEKGRDQLQGAGSIKRDCQRWEEFLTHYEIPFEEVAPRNNRTKMSADEFKRLTGWEGKTNEHGRDAAMLVFGL
jgi:predicted RNase H-like nuclease (RuvC/YqgF family)